MLGFLKALAMPSGAERNPHLAEAARCMEARDFTEAERHLTLATVEADRKQASAAQRIRVRIELAGTQRLAALAAGATPVKDHLDNALQTICAAIEIAARSSDMKAYVDCLDTQAAILQDMEQWPGLESVLQDAIRLSAALPHPDAQALARRVHHLATAHGRNSRQPEALAAFERALQMYDQAYGPASLDTAALLMELAAYLRSQRAGLRAQPYLKRALQIQEAQFGADSPQALQVVEQLAAVLEATGNHSAAAHHYERALAMKLRKLGIGNLDEIAEMQYVLAQRHIGWDNLTRARELLSECIGGFQRRGGPRYATALETLAQVENSSGRFPSAAQELERAANAWERCGPSYAGDLVRTLEQRATLLEQLHHDRDAQWLRKRAAELIAETKPAAPPVVRKLVRPAV